MIYLVKMIFLQVFQLLTCLLTGSLTHLRTYSAQLKSIQTRAWQGALCSSNSRALAWRYINHSINYSRSYSLTQFYYPFTRLFLKLIPDDVTQWKSVLQKQVIDYNELKKDILPSFDKVLNYSLIHLLAHSFTHLLTRFLQLIHYWLVTHPPHLTGRHTTKILNYQISLKVNHS